MKHQTMCKTVLIFGIFSNLLLCSCNEGEVEYLTREAYTYNNNTSYTVKLLKWKQGNQTVFTIQPNEALNYKIILGTGGECSVNDNISLGPDCLLIYSDSIKVIFNNSKFLEFDKNTNSNMNILKQENYDYEKVNKEHIYSYNFTELDYNNAEDCSGSCE